MSKEIININSFIIINKSWMLSLNKQDNKKVSIKVNLIAYISYIIKKIIIIIINIIGPFIKYISNSKFIIKKSLFKK